MAVAGTSRTTAMDPQETNEQEQFEMQLWQTCVKSEQPDRIWLQRDLMDLDIMKGKTVQDLVKCLNSLTARYLFRTMEIRNGEQCWKANPLTTATNMKQMVEAELLVFMQLESAGVEGMWTKNITQQTKLPSTEVSGALKKLENKGLIKPFKSAKHSHKKVYILSHLSPSDDATGGLFYSEGQIDTALISILMRWTEVYVHRKSWKMPEKASEAGGKRKRDDYSDPQDEDLLFASKRWKGVKPWPAGHQDYPGAGDVAKYLNKAGILYKDKIMEAEAQQILDLLCYDGRLEPVSHVEGYRSVLRPLADPWQQKTTEASRNGFGDVPCGGCPSFDLCDETGPVNARSCEYFGDWL